MISDQYSRRGQFSALAAGVTVAIVGGTAKFKKPHGTVTVKTPQFTYRVK